MAFADIFKSCQVIRVFCCAATYFVDPVSGVSTVGRFRSSLGPSLSTLSETLLAEVDRTNVSMIITKHRRPVAVLKPAHLRPRRLSQLSNSPYRIPSMIRFSTRKWLRGKVIRPLRTFACHPATLGRNVTVMQCNGPADHST
jgi:hypothetical protein